MKATRDVSEAERKQIAEFALLLNSCPESMSMFCPNRIDRILAEITECANQNVLAVCIEESEIIGAAWLFVDEERSCADANLFVAAKGEKQYAAIADALLNTLCAEFPNGIKLNFYFPKQNEDCRNYLKKANAKQNVNEYVLRVSRETVKNLAEYDGIEPVTEEGFPQFKALFEQSFPDGYISPEEILENQDGTRSAYVIKDGQNVAAFGIFQRKSERLGCAEILGVRPDYRRKGLGRKILTYLVEKGFSDPLVERVELIVDCDNEKALGLYFGVGFSVEYENNNFAMYYKK